MSQGKRLVTAPAATVAVPTEAVVLKGKTGAVRERLYYLLSFTELGTDRMKMSTERILVNKEGEAWIERRGHVGIQSYGDVSGDGAEAASGTVNRRRLYSICAFILTTFLATLIWIVPRVDGGQAVSQRALAGYGDAERGEARRQKWQHHDGAHQSPPRGPSGTTRPRARHESNLTVPLARSSSSKLYEHQRGRQLRLAVEGDRATGRPTGGGELGDRGRPLRTSGRANTRFGRPCATQPPCDFA